MDKKVSRYRNDLRQHPVPIVIRAAVEPVIGHLKAEHRMGRNQLKGRQGDRANTVLAAAGYNFSLHLRWLARFLRALIRPPIPLVPEARSI